MQIIFLLFIAPWRNLHSAPHDVILITETPGVIYIGVLEVLRHWETMNPNSINHRLSLGTGLFETH